MIYNNPILVIQPTCLMVYNHITQSNESRIRAMIRNSFDCYEDYAEWKAEQVNEEKYTGVLSPSAARNLKYRIQLLVAQARWKENVNPSTGTSFKWKINFCTLTLSAPQGTLSDVTIKKQMFEPWLRIMREKFKLRSYLWRAERQMNGNIHFHVTTDSWLDLADIRTNWNNQQNKFHFISEFRESNDSPWPNSTDVRSTRSINDLAAYMVKYMGKDPEEHLKEINKTRKANRLEPINPDHHPWRKIEGQPKWNDPIDGRVWDCSRNLKTSKKVKFPFQPATYTYIHELKKHFKVLDNGDNLCEIICMRPEQFRQWLPSTYYKRYQKFINEIYNNARNEKETIF